MKHWLILLLLAAAACAPMRNHVWQAPKDESGFLSNLAAEYRDLAGNLRELDHLQAAVWMEAKAGQAQQGETPKPELPGEGLQDAYRRLSAVLEDRPKRIVAQTAARAQALYDCQALHEHLPDEITSGCREEFVAALEVLENVMEGLTPRFRHNICFEAGSAALSPEGYRQIGRITSQVLSLKSYTIRVVGHDAPSEDPKKDWDMALQRAQRVGEALREAGVPDERIREMSLGSSAPPPGVEEPELLRCVEIRIHLK